MFYPLIRVLSPHPCFIPSSVFYPLIRVLSPHPCFIPSSVFYPPIRVLSSHPCFIPSSVFYPLIRIRVSVSVFYSNPIFTAVYQVIVTNSLHVFLLIVRSIYIRPGHAHIWVVIVKGGELLGRRSVWKLALTLSFLIYVIKSQEFVFLLTINRSRPIGKRTNFVTVMCVNVYKLVKQRAQTAT